MKSLRIATSPFTHSQRSTPGIMFEVILAVLPVFAFAVWHFGLSALLITLTSVAGCMFVEFLVSRQQAATRLGDNSALLTGLLLGLTLPSGFPLWMAFLGGMVAIALGKSIWGGLGQNQFNPAIVGRAFLQAAFPTAITTWPKPTGNFWAVPETLFAAPFFHKSVDIVTAATPLGKAKFDGATTAVHLLFTGSTGGSLGETSAVILILCGLWLAFRRVFDWRLPVSAILTMALGTWLLNLLDDKLLQTPLFMLTSGGFLFAAVYMITDPATTPTTARGAWIFGIGFSLLTILIRLYGGFPEGVMYAILLMNAVVPHINRYTQPRVFGTARGKP